MYRSLYLPTAASGAPSQEKKTRRGREVAGDEGSAEGEQLLGRTEEDRDEMGQRVVDV